MSFPYADARELRTKGVIRGAITLAGNFKRMSTEAATLRVTYWPDRNQPEFCAEVIMQEAR